MRKTDFSGILTAILILLFVYTGVSKLADFSHFERSIHLQHFPKLLERLLTSTLPFIEIAVAFVLFLERTRRAGLMVSLFLLMAFTLYIIAILLHITPRTPCPCGGAITTLTWPQHLIFNTLLVLINGLAIYFNNDDPSGFLQKQADTKDISRAK